MLLLPQQRGEKPGGCNEENNFIVKFENNKMRNVKILYGNHVYKCLK
jgi:hypothetical protein